jgi:hypothetical protein
MKATPPVGSARRIIRRMTTADAALAILPANAASFEDLQAVFGERGPARVCQCQRYKLAPREAFRSFPAAERAQRLRA